MMIKDLSVRIDGVRPELLFAMFTVEQVVDRHWKLPNGITITSCTDSEHESASLHYVGCAFDFRSSDIHPDLLETIVKDAKDALGVTFDVVLEKDHIHVEFQPKTGLNL